MCEGCLFGTDKKYVKGDLDKFAKDATLCANDAFSVPAVKK